MLILTLFKNNVIIFAKVGQKSLFFENTKCKPMILARKRGYYEWTQRKRY